jgi:hypothetical protein
LHLFASQKSSSWAVNSTEVLFTALLCPAYAHTLRMAFSTFSVTVHMLYRVLKSSFPSSPVLLCINHNRCTFRALPHFSQCASSKILNVIQYFIHLLYYRSCFCSFIHDGIILRFQRC